jgi:hypothetical protein
MALAHKGRERPIVLNSLNRCEPTGYPHDQGAPSKICSSIIESSSNP